MLALGVSETTVAASSGAAAQRVPAPLLSPEGFGSPSAPAPRLGWRRAGRERDIQIPSPLCSSATAFQLGMAGGGRHHRADPSSRHLSSPVYHAQMTPQRLPLWGTPITHGQGVGEPGGVRMAAMVPVRTVQGRRREWMGHPQDRPSSLPSIGNTCTRGVEPERCLDISCVGAEQPPHGGLAVRLVEGRWPRSVSGLMPG